MSVVSQREVVRGLWIATASFVLWGVMPLYWHMLKAVPSLSIVLHRIAWSAVFVCGWLFVTKGRHWLRATLVQPRLAWMLALSGVFISINWGLYIWAVNAGHIVEASLGYFINPLLNVLFGVLFLRERLRAMQWLSVAIAAVGVLWLTFHYGSFPWIALALATSFAMYGLIRKLAAVDPIAGLGVESAYLFLPVVVLLLWSETQGSGGFGADYGAWASFLLVFGGVVTALPLVGFAYALQRVPLASVGLLQYIAPTMQLLIGVLVFHEPFGRDRAIGFACIWIALAVFAIDSVVRARRQPAVATA